MDWEKQLKNIQEDSSFLLCESKIRTWLEHIEETDSDIVEEVIKKCRTDPEAKRYFLLRSEETPKPYHASSRTN